MLEAREWYKRDGASTDELELLQRLSPVTLPRSYLDLLSFSNGGEGSLSVQPFNLCLDPVSIVIDGLQTGNFDQPELDGFVIFGGNGGGEYLAFDTRQSEPWPVVSIDMVAGKESAKVVATSFDTFLEYIGRE